MRYTLLTMTLVAGLVTSLSSAAGDLESCLADNADKSEKMTLCLDKLHSALSDSRKQELQQKFDQALTDLNKQQQDQAKNNPSQTPVAPQTPSTTNSAITPGSDSTSTGTSSSSAQNNASSESSSSTASSSSTSTDQSTTPAKKSVDVRPEPRDKPKGVQWY